MCTAATGFVMLEDVFRHGAPVTTAHIATGMALIVTVAAGHWLWPQVRQLRLLCALALAVLFSAGTAYVVSTSAGRNSMAVTQKMLALAHANDVRKTAVARLSGAEAEALASREAARVECATGKAVRCAGRVTVRDADARRVADLQDALGRLPPPVAEVGSNRHVALTFSAFGIGDADEMEDRMGLIVPFLLALILEVGAVVFASIGLGRRDRSDAVAIVPNRSTVAITERQEPLTDDEIDDLKRIYAPVNGPEPKWTFPRTVRDRPWTRAEAEADLVTIIELNNGRVPAQTVLVHRWQVAKSTVSVWCALWHATGLIDRDRAGRCKTVALAA
jgi:hypothetical protein